MKAVISTDENYVSAHFGRCPSFTIIEIENKKVINKEIINNPGHYPGYLPQFFNEKGVECIIAGGMGRNATNLFNQFNIKQYVGISGKIEDIINQLVEGTLIAGDSLCNPGKGKGYGIDKTVCNHDNHNHGGEE